ncbi:hypothetical protein MM808_32580, partial [Klebsiella pneumoniae]|nr:hypothetical protein [Klebsiella pneumoniae]
MPSEGKTAEPVTNQENNDVPPWEDAPDEAQTAAGTTAQTSAKSIQTASEAETPPENQVSKNKAADNETGAPLSEVPAGSPIQATPSS